MLGFGKKVKVTTSVAGVNSIISEGTSVHGPITFKGAIKVAGDVQGSLNGTDEKDNTSVIVESSGTISGNIKCQNVIVSGVVEGDIVADSVYISKTGRVHGKVTYKGLQMEPGSQVNGNLDCVLNTVPAKDTELVPRSIVPMPSPGATA